MEILPRMMDGTFPLCVFQSATLDRILRQTAGSSLHIQQPGAMKKIGYQTDSEVDYGGAGNAGLRVLTDGMDNVALILSIPSACMMFPGPVATDRYGAVGTVSTQVAITRGIMGLPPLSPENQIIKQTPIIGDNV